MPACIRRLAGVLVLALAASGALAARAAEPEPQRPDAEMRCLALAVYWEGRDESHLGQVAIAHTVLNRTRSPAFPQSICAVVKQRNAPGKKGCQFSWWCDGKADKPRNEEQWSDAVAVAEGAMAGRSHDPTGGALFFHSARIRPNWTGHRKRLIRIGNHVFYK
ncbi:MAG TPA: cell wall hydrolase [Ferrovibrio sp.]|uniref:cell wall hydrolase n=1 Tax=Ferrovibrio sp. TaxID=1917215 RepID=UPI002ED452A8